MKVVTTFEEAFKLAIERYRQADYSQAESILRKLSSMKPAHEPVRDALIQAIFDQGKTAEAMALYDEAVAAGAYACDAVYDAGYREALLATRYCPAPLRRRAKYYTLVNELARTSARAGDTAECGCYRGLSSHLMLGAILRGAPGYAGENHHIFDSFQGLSGPTSHDAIMNDSRNADGLRHMSSAGAFAASLAEVRQALSKFPRVVYHPGWIPSSFEGLAERNYRFVHLDVDLHDPTRACLEYFHPRMTRAGIIVCDDYGWPGARRAIEEFCTRVHVEFTVTPHDQAVLVCS